MHCANPTSTLFPYTTLFRSCGHAYDCVHDSRRAFDFEHSEAFRRHAGGADCSVSGCPAARVISAAAWHPGLEVAVEKIGRAHVCTPVTDVSRMSSSA